MTVLETYYADARHQNDSMTVYTYRVAIGMKNVMTGASPLVCDFSI